MTGLHTKYSVVRHDAFFKKIKNKNSLSSIALLFLFLAKLLNVTVCVSSLCKKC